MTNLKFLELQTFARQNAKDSARAKVLLSVALAIIASFEAPIPSNETDTPTFFYVNNVQGQINERFNEFNEQVLLSLDTYQDLARSLWMMRYRAAMGELGSTGGTNVGFIGMLFGATTYISEETLVFLNANSAILSSLAIRIKAVMAENKAI